MEHLEDARKEVRPRASHGHGELLMTLRVNPLKSSNLNFSTKEKASLPDLVSSLSLGSVSPRGLCPPPCSPNALSV